MNARGLQIDDARSTHVSAAYASAAKPAGLKYAALEKQTEQAALGNRWLWHVDLLLGSALLVLAICVLRFVPGF
jgi:hypothetical protein